MRFTATAAKDNVRIAIAADKEPKLTDAEIVHCLSYAAVVDESGLYPSDDDYTPTYSTLSLNLAYARACRLKAMKLGEAADYSDQGGNNHRPQDRRQFFLDMARDYEAKASSVANVRVNRYADPYSDLDIVIVN